MQISFTKLHGLANDFVLIDNRRGARLKLSRTQISTIADRKQGVGFDQLLVLEKSPNSKIKFSIYNADGSSAEMCGNGLRAAALYVWLRQSRNQSPLTFLTPIGPLRAWLKGASIETEMGVPKILPVPRTLRNGISISGALLGAPVCVDVGNPHAVFFRYPRTREEFTRCGSKIETHTAFPNRTNVEFVRVVSRSKIEVCVWERGVGITEACGTGAVAAACAAISQGIAQSPVSVKFAAGAVKVCWDGGNSTMAFLTGTAYEVFSGTFNI